MTVFSEKGANSLLVETATCDPVLDVVVLLLDKQNGISGDGGRGGSSIFQEVKSCLLIILLMALSFAAFCSLSFLYLETNIE